MNPITDFGAKPGGEIVVTREIQKAIDATAEQGGGIVFVPPGIWLTGAVRLRSGVWLEFSPGAVVLGSPNPADYPPAPLPAYRSYHDAAGFRALIYAEGAENVGLIGGGLIDGQGDRFPFRADDHDGRPRLLQFVSCRDVTVRDLRLRNSAMWMQHYLNCERVQVRGLRVWNHANHNNDMLDLDGCRGVTVSDCIGDTDDDGITLKSTGRAPCEDVVIANCLVSSRCNAFKCGTESTGGFRNISITNCAVRPTAAKTGIYGHPEGISGVSLEIVDGGTMEGVLVSNMVIEGTRSPLFVRLANRARQHVNDAPRPGIGRMRHVHLDHVIVRCAGAIGSSITAIPGACIEHVTLSRFLVENAVPAPPDVAIELPGEHEACYPEATMFGLLPAHGLFVRHARDVRLQDVTFLAAAGDPRPPIVTHQTRDFHAGGLPVTLM